MGKQSIKQVAANRKAFHDYFIEDKYEAGIELAGTEVKSIRLGAVNLRDSFCAVKDGEMFLYGMHISPYEKGNIFNKDNGGYLGTVGVYGFEDLEQLEHNDAGFFTGEGAQPNTDVTICNKMVERSNSNMVHEMVSMMSAQRALQSAAQMSKIYDQVMTKDTTELGRM